MKKFRRAAAAVICVAILCLLSACGKNETAKVGTVAGAAAVQTQTGETSGISGTPDDSGSAQVSVLPEESKTAEEDLENENGSGKNLAENAIQIYKEHAYPFWVFGSTTAELTGDDVPELIALECTDDMGGTVHFHVYTISDEQIVREIYDGLADMTYSAGSAYYLLKKDGQDYLYHRVNNMNEGYVSYSYSVFMLDGDENEIEKGGDSLEGEYQDLTEEEENAFIAEEETYETAGKLICESSWTELFKCGNDVFSDKPAVVAVDSLLPLNTIGDEGELRHMLGSYEENKTWDGLKLDSYFGGLDVMDITGTGYEFHGLRVGMTQDKAEKLLCDLEAAPVDENTYYLPKADGDMQSCLGVTYDGGIIKEILRFPDWTISDEG